jgi:hypothetical protein
MRVLYFQPGESVKSLLLVGFNGLNINAKGIAMQLVVARLSQKGSQNAKRFVILCSAALAANPGVIG